MDLTTSLGISSYCGVQRGELKIKERKRKRGKKKNKIFLTCVARGLQPSKDPILRRSFNAVRQRLYTYISGPSLLNHIYIYIHILWIKTLEIFYFNKRIISQKVQNLHTFFFLFPSKKKKKFITPRKSLKKIFSFQNRIYKNLIHPPH